MDDDDVRLESIEGSEDDELDPGDPNVDFRRSGGDPDDREPYESADDEH